MAEKPSPLAAMLAAQRLKLGKNNPAVAQPPPAHDRFRDEVQKADTRVEQNDVKTWSRKLWLTYFWNEAVAAANKSGDERSKNAVIQAYDVLFPGGVLRGDLDTMDADLLRTQLTKLLFIGFDGVDLPLGPLGPDARPANMISQSRHGQEHMEVVIGFRSESRSWESIQSTGGTKRQVDVPQKAAEYNMDKSWHPYSQQQVKNCLWFRAGVNYDNCKYSVASIGKDFKTVTAFPELCDTTAYSFPAGPVDKWTDAERLANLGNLAGVRLGDGKLCQMLATQVWVFMFLVKGPVLDTRGLQKFYGADPFPEWGVREIPLDDIYAWFRVVRVHYGPEKGDGYTGFIRESGYAFPEQDRELKYGGALQQLEAKYKAVAALQSFVYLWRTADAQSVSQFVRNKPMPVTDLICCPFG